MKKGIQLLYLLGFGFLIGLVPLSFLFTDYQQQKIENRKLAEKPDWNWEGSSIFAEQYEAYFNDHFPYRDRLFKADSELKVHWLLKSPKPERVLIGEEGWLFLTGERTLDQYRGVDPLEKKELDKIVQKVKEKKAWCEGQGILYTIVICPEKHSIYPEFLPDWMQSNGQQSRTDQLLEQLKAIDDLLVIDLRPVLQAFKKEQSAPIYYKYDTHWNHLGAYGGYRGIVDGLNQRLPVPLRNWAAYEQRRIEKEGGDLGRLLNRPFIKDSVPSLFPLFEQEAKGDSLTSQKLEKYKLTFAAFQSPDPALQKKLLVFNDSYSVSLRRYLKDSFQQSAFVWNHHFNKKIVKELEPDIVIHEFVERYVHRVGW